MPVQQGAASVQESAAIESRSPVAIAWSMTRFAAKHLSSGLVKYRGLKNGFGATAGAAEAMAARMELVQPVNVQMQSTSTQPRLSRSSV